MICPKCKSEIEKNSKFCCYCGIEINNNEFNNTEDDQIVSDYTDINRRSRGISIINKVLAGVAIILAVAILTVVLKKHQNTKKNNDKDNIKASNTPTITATGSSDEESNKTNKSNKLTDSEIKKMKSKNYTIDEMEKELKQKKIENYRIKRVNNDSVPKDVVYDMYYQGDKLIILCSSSTINTNQTPVPTKAKKEDFSKAELAEMTRNYIIPNSGGRTFEDVMELVEDRFAFSAREYNGKIYPVIKYWHEDEGEEYLFEICFELKPNDYKPVAVFLLIDGLQYSNDDVREMLDYINDMLDGNLDILPSNTSTPKPTSVPSTEKNKVTNEIIYDSYGVKIKATEYTDSSNEINIKCLIENYSGANLKVAIEGIAVNNYAVYDFMYLASEVTVGNGNKTYLNLNIEKKNYKKYNIEDVKKIDVTFKFYDESQILFQNSTYYSEPITIITNKDDGNYDTINGKIIYNTNGIKVEYVDQDLEENIYSFLVYNETGRTIDLMSNDSYFIINDYNINSGEIWEDMLFGIVIPNGSAMLLQTDVSKYLEEYGIDDIESIEFKMYYVETLGSYHSKETDVIKYLKE